MDPVFTIAHQADVGVSVLHADQAEPDKVDFKIIAAGATGDGVVSGCAVTAQGSPNMTVAVGAGSVAVNAAAAAVSGGNVTIAAANGSNPRFDLIVVNDAGAKSAVTGSAAADPVFPAIPANSVVLAAIYVPAADAAINANQIVDKRVFVPNPGPSSGAFDAKVAKTADESVASSTALQDDNDLVLALGANQIWQVKLVLRAVSASGTPMLKTGFTVPAGATIGGVAIGPNAANTDDSRPVTEAAVLDFLLPATAIFEMVVVTAGTAGNFKLQWAQNTSNATATVMKAGSILLAHRVV